MQPTNSKVPLKVVKYWMSLSLFRFCTVNIRIAIILTIASLHSAASEPKFEYLFGPAGRSSSRSSFTVDRTLGKVSKLECKAKEKIIFTLVLVIIFKNGYIAKRLLCSSNTYHNILQMILYKPCSCEENIIQPNKSCDKSSQEINVIWNHLLNYSSCH